MPDPTPPTTEALGQAQEFQVALADSLAEAEATIARLTKERNEAVQDRDDGWALFRESRMLHQVASRCLVGAERRIAQLEVERDGAALHRDLAEVALRKVEAERDALARAVALELRHDATAAVAPKEDGR